MPQIPESIKKDVMMLQQMQQQSQMFMFQKQSVQLQTSEIDNAIKELEKTQENEVYEIVGTIMLKKDRKELEKALKEKKEVLDLRLTTIDKQLEKIESEARKLQEKVSKEIKSGE